MRGQHEPEPLPEEPRYTPAAEPHVVNHFPTLDPRVAAFRHPQEWPEEARERYADDIAKGVAAGWWDGLRRHRGGRR